MENLLHDPAFWVAVSIILFIVFTAGPIGRMLGGALDGRSAAIESELAEATRLREEAQSTLAAYQKKQKEIEVEAVQIVESAKKEAETMKAQASKQLNTAVEKRIAMADDRIAKEEERAVQQVQKQVVQVAMSTARDILTDKFSKDADGSLVDLAMKDIERLVH